MKKTLAILLSCLMLMGLVACTQHGETKVEKTDKESEPVVTEETQKEAGETTLESEEDKTEESKTVESAESSDSVIKIKNVDREIEFDKKPEKVVCLSFSSAETLAALGVSDKVIGVSRHGNTNEDILPKYQEAVAAIPDINEVLNLEDPSAPPVLENLVALEPDLLIIDNFLFNVEGFGTPEDYEKANIKLYVTEATAQQKPTLESTYLDVENLGKIFRVEDKAELLIKECKDRVDAIQKKIKNAEPRKVMLLNSMKDDKALVAGARSLANDLTVKAGGKNIFDDLDKPFAVVTFEEIIDRNPEAIAIFVYGDNTLEAVSGQVKDKHEFSKVTAVENELYIPIKLLASRASIQNVDAIEALAKALYPDLFN